MSAGARPDVPAVVRRHTWLLFLAAASLSTGLSTSAQLGSLIIYSLSGTAALAGLPTALNALTVTAIGYPAGRFMDRHGRRPGLMIGFFTGAVGAVLVSLAVTSGRLVAYLLSAVVFSAGVAVSQLTRAAVADMYPATLRAGAVGLVVAGGLLGGVGGPMLVALGERVAHATSAHPLAVPWVFVVATFVLAAGVLARLKPDPREIGRRIGEYFPRAHDVAIVVPRNGWIEPGTQQASVGEIIRSRPAQAAIITLAGAQATMTILMATSSLMMSLHGHEMSTISLALMAHVVGMFGLSVPVGRLADRIGRRPVLIAGALLSAASGLMFTLGIHSAAIAMVAFYLVGLGWCLAFVAGAALLGDLSTASTRARVVSLSDVLSHASAAVAAVASGVLLSRGGEVTVGVLAAVMGTLPLLAIARAGLELRALAPALPVEGGGQ
ncbi:MAG: MFS transporter [Armatimonadota bacterium]|nr:MFS transporter [Armatimonadota bacterium]